MEIELNNPATIKTYFEKIRQLAIGGEKYPVTLNDVWPLAFSTKGNALKALEGGFIVEVDYQVFIQNDKNPQGGRPESDYRMTLACLEYFIARRVRTIFEVYRQVFHNAIQVGFLPLPSYQIDNPIERAERWIIEQKEKQALILQNEELRPKAEYAEAVLLSTSALTTTKIAQELGMTAQKLNKLLAERGVQYKQSRIWNLKRAYNGKGFAKLSTFVHVGRDGKSRTEHSLVWTETGRKFIHELLNSAVKI